MPAGKSEVCSATQLRITRRSRAVKSATELFWRGGSASLAEFCPAAEAECGPLADGCGPSAWLGGFSLALLPTAEFWVVTKVKTASESTTASRLPVAAAAPVPAAPPATVPMAAPLPPPATAPMIAPSAAPPPILVALLLVCDSPLTTSGSDCTEDARLPDAMVASSNCNSPGSLNLPDCFTSATRPVTSAPLG